MNEYKRKLKRKKKGQHIRKSDHAHRKVKQSLTKLLVAEKPGVKRYVGVAKNNRPRKRRTTQSTTELRSKRGQSRKEISQGVLMNYSKARPKFLASRTNRSTRGKGLRKKKNEKGTETSKRKQHRDLRKKGY